MNLKFNSSIILIFLLIQSVLSFENSVDLKVGVSPFKNLNDNDFGNHLSLVLNSTLESALNQRYQIPIIERASLGELLSEEALQANSNSFDILPIDYLIVGSYSGNESNMVVIIKMLDAKSTLSKYQTRLNGNLQQVMEQLYLVAGNISDELKGKNKSASQGFLTLKGEPEGASVYEGNKLIGTIPILEKPIEPGEHHLTILQDEYEASEITLVVEPQRSTVKNIQLERARFPHYINFGLGYQLQQPLVAQSGNEEFSNLKSMSLIAARQFNAWSIIFKTGGSQFLAADGNTRLKYEWEVPSDVEPKLSEQRQIEMMYWSTKVLYSFHSTNANFNPYLGLGGGFVWLFDKSSRSDWFKDEVGTYRSPIIQGEAGVKLMPNAPFGVNFHLTLTRTIKEIPFQTIGSVDQLGGVALNKNSSPMSFVGIGIEVVAKVGN